MKLSFSISDFFSNLHNFFIFEDREKIKTDLESASMALSNGTIENGIGDFFFHIILKLRYACFFLKKTYLPEKYVFV